MPQPWKFKVGQWVKVGDRIGILAAIGDDDSEVHFVNANRETEKKEVIKNSLIIRPRLQDLPEKARADMAETDRVLGGKRVGTFGAPDTGPKGGAATQGPR